MVAGARTQLYAGCRRGDPAALDALLYGCADEVYALALTAMYDEAAARECLRETWGRLLRSLGRLRFNKVPREGVRRIAYQVVAERVGEPAARAARRTVTRPDGTLGLEGVHAPEALLKELAALSSEHAPALRIHAGRRRHLFRGALVGLFAVTIGVWSAVFYQHSSKSNDLAHLQYRCLRERVIEQELATTVRVASGQLEDPTGADREASTNCERIVLVFEEIANNERLETVSGLRHIRQRIIKNQLAEFARSMPRDSEELRRNMPRVALVLEEVQNL